MHEVLETMLATFQLTNNLVNITALFSSIMSFKWLLLFMLFHISVGAPIPVRKVVPNPSTQQVNKLHKRYVQELINLFEEHKHRYGLPTTVKLNIVWWKLFTKYLLTHEQDTSLTKISFYQQIHKRILKRSISHVHYTLYLSWLGGITYICSPSILKSRECLKESRNLLIENNLVIIILLKISGKDFIWTILFWMLLVKNFQKNCCIKILYPLS